MTETRDKVAEALYRKADELGISDYDGVAFSDLPEDEKAISLQLADAALAALQAPAVGGVEWMANVLFYHGREIGRVTSEDLLPIDKWIARLVNDIVGYYGTAIEARAALEAAARQWLGLTGEDWRPIETAPKDGTEILAAIEVHSSRNGGCTYWERHVIAFNEDAGRIADDLGWEWDDYTHWKPLPAAPTPVPEKGTAA